MVIFQSLVSGLAVVVSTLRVSSHQEYDPKLPAPALRPKPNDVQATVPLYEWTYNYDSQKGEYVSKPVRRKYGDQSMISVAKDYLYYKYELKSICVPIVGVLRDMLNHINVNDNLDVHSDAWNLSFKTISDSHLNAVFLGDEEDFRLADTIDAVRQLRSKLVDKANEPIIHNPKNENENEEEETTNDAHPDDHMDIGYTTHSEVFSEVFSRPQEDIHNIFQNLVQSAVEQGLEFHLCLSYYVILLGYIDDEMPEILRPHFTSPITRSDVLEILRNYMSLSLDGIQFHWNELITPQLIDSGQLNDDVDDLMTEYIYDGVGPEQANEFLADVRNLIASINREGGRAIQLGVLVKGFDYRLDLSNVDYIITISTASLASGNPQTENIETSDNKPTYPSTILQHSELIEYWDSHLNSYYQSIDVGLVSLDDYKVHLYCWLNTDLHNLAAEKVQWTNPNELINQLKFNRSLGPGVVDGSVLPSSALEKVSSVNPQSFAQYILTKALDVLMTSTHGYVAHPPYHARLAHLIPEPNAPYHLSTDYYKGQITTRWQYDDSITSDQLRFHVVYAVPVHGLSSIDLSSAFSTLQYVVARVNYADSVALAKPGDGPVFTGKFVLPSPDYMLFASTITRTGFESRIRSMEGHLVDGVLLGTNVWMLISTLILIFVVL